METASTIPPLLRRSSASGLPELPPTPKVLDQFTSEHATRLNEQGAVDRLVRDVHARVARVAAPEPPRHLLRGPVGSELRRHHVPKASIRGELTGLGPPRRQPGFGVSRTRPKARNPAVSVDLATDRARRTVQLPRDRPHALPGGYSSRDRLALGQAQDSLVSPSRRWLDPSAREEMRVDRAGLTLQRIGDVGDPVAAPPSAPEFGSIVCVILTSSGHGYSLRGRSLLRRPHESACRLLREGSDVSFELVRAEEATYPTALMCRAMDLSRSGYHAWKTRGPSAREQDSRRLDGEVAALFVEKKQRYGAPRLQAELGRRGRRTSRKRVARSMRTQQLAARRRRRFVATTDSRHAERISPNLLKRRFTVPAPDRAWVADTTYLPVLAGFVYLVAVIDLYSRRIVG